MSSRKIIDKKQSVTKRNKSQISNNQEEEKKQQKSSKVSLKQSVSPKPKIQSKKITNTKNQSKLSFKKKDEMIPQKELQMKEQKIETNKKTTKKGKQKKKKFNDNQSEDEMESEEESEFKEEDLSQQSSESVDSYSGLDESSSEKSKSESDQSDKKKFIEISDQSSSDDDNNQKIGRAAKMKKKLADKKKGVESKKRKFGEFTKDQEFGNLTEQHSNINIQQNYFKQRSQRRKEAFKAEDQEQDIKVEQVRKLPDFNKETIQRPKRSVPQKKTEIEIESNQIHENKTPLDTCLEGLTIVVTGLFQGITREFLEEFIKNHGGRNTGSISGKTNILVTGYKLEDGREVTQGNKFKEAEKRGIQILDENSFQQFIRDKSGDTEFTLNTRTDILNQLSTEKLNFEERVSVKKSLGKDQEGQPKVCEMWTEIYKPESIQDLLGNEGAVNQLFEWLRDWDDVHVHGNKKQVSFNRFAFKGNWDNMPRLNAKAALVSGPPGIGKTSACRILCKTLGYETLELNASDSRSKLQIEQELTTISSNKSIDYYYKQNEQDPEHIQKQKMMNTQKKSVIIMDEVDGCGASDRGGISALIQIIKNTKTPIICICNDRQNRKLQSLVTHCFEVKFQIPQSQSIEKRIQMIIKNENLEISDDTVKKIISSTSGGDIRQIINILQMWKKNNQNLGQQIGNKFFTNIQKDESVMINNFDAAHKLLNCGEISLENKYPQFRQKLDLFFIDHEFVPLLIQEGYLGSFKERKSDRDLEKMAEAADMISISDCINVQIRKNMNWALLPNYGTMSSIGPCLLIQGQSFFPGFPQWLGKNSTARKSKRLIRELKQAMAYRINADRYSIQNEIIPLIIYQILSYLKKGTKDSIEDLIQFLDDFNITQEMVKEHMMGLILDKKIHESFDKIESGVKSLFTREFNKSHQAIVRKGAKQKINPKDLDDEEKSNSDQESDNNDVLIDEEELAEIKRAKKIEKEQKKAQLAMKRIQQLTKVTKIDESITDKKSKQKKSGASKKQGGKKGKKAGKGKKVGGKKKKSDEEELASDDSLNDFIVDDDEDID